MEKAKKSKKWWWIGGILFVLFVIGVLAPSEETMAKSKEVQTSQQAFINAVTSSMAEYKASNELKKPAVRNMRRQKIRAALKEKREVVNWVGTIKEMGSWLGGAYIYIEPEGSRFLIITSMGAFGMPETLIPEGSTLYNAVADLKGNKVIFSGSFMQSDEDFVKEYSLHEIDSMLNPKFVFTFSEIKDYNQ